MHPIFAVGLPHGTEWIWILLIFLLLFGANKLPQLARGLGKSLGEFKKAKDEFEKELHSATVEEQKKAADAPLLTSTPAATPTSPGTPVDESAKKS
jgi:TatA/E family protein of Tat protein translocase